MLTVVSHSWDQQGKKINVLCGLMCCQDLCRGKDAHCPGESKPSAAACHAYQGGKKRVEETVFNYSRATSWKEFQDREPGMRCSFVGTLLSSLPLPAMGRRVDYMSMKKKKINFSLHAALGFYLFWFCLLGNLNNCLSVTTLMTLFCLAQNGSTSKSTGQKSISPKGALSAPLCAQVGMFSCPSLALCCEAACHWAILLAVGFVTMQKNLLLSVLPAVLCYSYARFKSWEMLTFFFMILGQIHPRCNDAVGLCWGQLSGLCLLTLKYCGSCLASDVIFIVRWRK